MDFTMLWAVTCFGRPKAPRTGRGDLDLLGVITYLQAPHYPFRVEFYSVFCLQGAAGTAIEAGARLSGGSADFLKVGQPNAEVFDERGLLYFWTHWNEEFPSADAYRAEFVSGDAVGSPFAPLFLHPPQAR